MQIVVDASAILAVLLNETTKPAIIEATTGMEAISPSSLPWEVGNALSANVKRKRLTTEQALQAAQAYQKISVRLIDVDIEQAIRISNELNLYAYDAYILLCAFILKAPLLCLDKQMANLAKGMGIKTIEV
jgi:predicted nucleic acid-binding protein